MLVEDDPADAFVVERCLADTPYRLLHVMDLRGAERALRQVQPAVILLDLLLATEEAWPLLLRLRQDEAHAQIPLVVVSSTGEERKARHLGADEYLSKPLHRDQLLHLLDSMTGRRVLTRVLLVDDDDVTQYLVRQLLPRSEYSVDIASGGDELIDPLIPYPAWARQTGRC